MSPTNSAFSSANTFSFKSESAIFVVPATSPSFLTEIVYTISSPFLAGASTSFPFLVITLVFVASVNTGFFVGSGSPSSFLLDGSPSTVATFFIVPLASLLTVTLKETEYVFPDSIPKFHKFQ